MSYTLFGLACALAAMGMNLAGYVDYATWPEVIHRVLWMAVAFCFARATVKREGRRDDPDHS